MNGQFKDDTIIRAINKDDPQSEKIPALHFLTGPSMGKLFPLLEGEWTIGRNEKSDFPVKDEAISRFHCKFIVKNNQVTVEDLQSANGSFVNGEKITRHKLQTGDKIRISSESLIRFDYVDQFDTASFHQLYNMAVVDIVTGAHTKRYFLDQLALEFSYSKRRNTHLSLILFDIDFFKNINDTYGHLAGDTLLKKLSEMTQLIIRKEDIFARYGGEEFAILMRDTQLPDAIRLAERLRLIVSEANFEFEGKMMQTTISFGVACHIDHNFQEPEDLIKEADYYLYLAKQKGRNRVLAKPLLTST